ncbi:hypothetical protein AZ78_1289 [Lysobacter capsici AZ78]|uniref:Uncharacterized protein n=1 Tax=Lysobacter capsici AZ78 TaxID=1444315 RepID=A0A120AFY5_9GAMM|nr:hypothetical protein [Lysobacter capsici]KWS03740.1 hypothetical protein AZ78_1289 [Lysobacter capsici AZ78]
METIFAFLTVIAVIIAVIYTLMWSVTWFTIVRLPGSAAVILPAISWPAYWVPFFAWVWLAVRYFA